MKDKRSNEAQVERTLRSLEAEARKVTQQDLAEKAEKAIQSLQQQRHLSQEELHRVVTI